MKIFLIIKALMLCLLLTVLTLSSRARNFDATDLVLYYSFNADTLVEGDILDESGNGNNGLLRGNLKIVGGKVNECIEFPGGAANYIAVRNVHYVEGIPALSISVWIKTSQRGMIASWDRSEFFRFAVADDQLGNNTFIAFDICCPIRDWHGDVEVIDDEWHHVVVTFNAEAKRIYVDGKLDVEAVPEQQFIGPKAKRFGFIGIGSEAVEFDGNRGPTWSFKGLMDEFLMFQRVLSEKEIKRLTQGPGNPFAVEPADKLSTTWGRIKSVK